MKIEMNEQPASVDSTITEHPIDIAHAVALLQSAIGSIQDDNTRLVDENDQLKQKLMSALNWNAEARKYNLVEAAPGVFVYSIGEYSRGTQPQHWLCTACYGKQMKAILQRGREVPDKGYCFSCHNCGLEIVCRPQQSVKSN